MVNKYQALGFLGGLVGTASVGIALTLIGGGGLIILGEEKKYDDAGWGVVAGAGASVVLLIALATWILATQPEESAAAGWARAYLEAHPSST